MMVGLRTRGRAEAERAGEMEPGGQGLRASGPAGSLGHGDWMWELLDSVVGSGSCFAP